MIDLSKIKQHKNYTHIFLSRVAFPGVRLTLRFNKIKDYKFYRYDSIPDGIKIPDDIKLDPLLNDLIEPKPVLLVSHYDPEEFTKLIWDMAEDEDVINERNEKNRQAAINHELYHIGPDGNTL